MKEIFLVNVLNIYMQKIHNYINTVDLSLVFDLL